MYFSSLYTCTCNFSFTPSLYLFFYSLPPSLSLSLLSLSLSLSLSCSVHNDTQCHIHFPDSNRYAQGEKSDQVSITGSLPAVETARINVRVSEL